VPAAVSDRLPQVPQDEPRSVDVHAYASIFLRRRRLVLATIAVVFILGMVYTVLSRPIYESSAPIVIITNRSTPMLTDSDLPAVGDLQALRASRSVDTQVVVASSPDLLADAYNSLSPKMRKVGFASEKIPDWAYKVERKRNADVMVVTGRAYSPDAAAALANAIAETYFRRDLNQNSMAARQARLYAQRKLADTDRQLAIASDQLSGFQRRTGLFAPDTQLTKAAENIAQLSMDLNSAQAEAASSRREIDALRQELPSQGEEVVSNTTLTTNPEYEVTLSRISQLNADRVALLQEYTSGSREVRAMDVRIKQEEAKLRNIARTVVGSKVRARNPVREALMTKYIADIASSAAAGTRARALQSQLAVWKHSVHDLPERERQFTKLSQRVALLQRTHEMLSGNYYTLLLSEHPMISNGVLVSRAHVPAKPIFPSPVKSAVFFLVAGGLMALALVLANERYDNRLHDQSAIERITGLTTLSVLPRIRPNAGNLHQQKGQYSALLESFRILRNNISFATRGRKMKVVAVTSPGQEEGKSTVAVNLGVVMAMEGKRVLLVDCHMRSPSLHRLVDIPAEVGLSTAINGDSTAGESVCPTKVENLSCLPCGPVPMNPAEILSSESSRSLFRRLAEQYDAILLDCPPCVGLSDVQTISTIADGVLLVVSMNETLTPQLHMAMGMLDQAQAPVMGLVLNKMDVHCGSYGYYCYRAPLRGYGVA
jgi:polysaccharide biosynthesis transport protein